jgi:hypothetical protein
MNILNYKRNNNIYNTHYYINKTDVGLGGDASRLNPMFDVDTSRPNMGLGMDTSRFNMGLGVDVSRFNMGLGVDVSRFNMGLAATASIPKWVWAWTHPDLSKGWA